MDLGPKIKKVHKVKINNFFRKNIKEKKKKIKRKTKYEHLKETNEANEIKNTDQK